MLRGKYHKPIFKNRIHVGFFTVFFDTVYPACSRAVFRRHGDCYGYRSLRLHGRSVFFQGHVIKYKITAAQCCESNIIIVPATYNGNIKGKLFVPCRRYEHAGFSICQAVERYKQEPIVFCIALRLRACIAVDGKMIDFHGVVICPVISERMLSYLFNTARDRDPR